MNGRAVLAAKLTTPVYPLPCGGGGAVFHKCRVAGVAGADVGTEQRYAARVLPGIGGHGDVKARAAVLVALLLARSNVVRSDVH